MNSYLEGKFTTLLLTHNTFDIKYVDFPLTHMRQFSVIQAGVLQIISDTSESQCRPHR